MDKLKTLNLNVKVGNKVPANDKNELDQKSQCTGNNQKELLVQSQSVQEFYDGKQRKANMANVNQRGFIRRVWSHRVGKLTELKRNWYTEFWNAPEPRSHKVRNHLISVINSFKMPASFSFFLSVVKIMGGSTRWWRVIPSLFPMSRKESSLPISVSRGRANSQDYAITNTT